MIQVRVDRKDGMGGATERGDGEGGNGEGRWVRGATGKEDRDGETGRGRRFWQAIGGSGEGEKGEG